MSGAPLVVSCVKQEFVKIEPPEPENVRIEREPECKPLETKPVAVKPALPEERESPVKIKVESNDPVKTEMNGRREEMCNRCSNFVVGLNYAIKKEPHVEYEPSVTLNIKREVEDVPECKQEVEIEEDINDLLPIREEIVEEETVNNNEGLEVPIEMEENVSVIETPEEEPDGSIEMEVMPQEETDIAIKRLIPQVEAATQVMFDNFGASTSTGTVAQKRKKRKTDEDLLVMMKTMDTLKDIANLLGKKETAQGLNDAFGMYVAKRLEGMEPRRQKGTRVQIVAILENL